MSQDEVAAASRCAGRNGCGAAVLAEHMRALPAHVVNCCGAGDCLAAGFLMRVMEGGSAVDALAHGLARCPAPASGGLPWMGSLWKLSAAILRTGLPQELSASLTWYHLPQVWSVFCTCHGSSPCSACISRAEVAATCKPTEG